MQGYKTVSHYKKNISLKSPKRILGITLIELMIAITISSIVALGIGSVYTSSKRSFKLQEEFSRLQENGRFAMNYIARFVRGAGYYGCASGLNNMINDIDSTDDEYLFSTGIEGYEAAGTAPNESVSTLAEYPTASASTSDFAIMTSTGPVVNIGATSLAALSPIADSDILVARVAEDSGIEITDNGNSSAQFRVNYVSTETNGCQNGTSTGYNGLCADDFLVVSDCDKSIAFQISSLGKVSADVKINHSKSGTPGNKSASWGGNSSQFPEGYDFAAGSEIVQVVTKYFFVAAGINGPALFMKEGKATPLELVEGVESMQVLYGMDVDGDNIPDRYVPADKVSDYPKVSAVRITLLLRSVKNLAWRTQQSKPYLLGGMTTATATTVNGANDKRLRRTMSMTIKLRNRAFSL